MRWKRAAHGEWSKWFAILPVTIRQDDGTRLTVWLEPFWARFCGEYTEVSIDEPKP